MKLRQKTRFIAVADITASIRDSDCKLLVEDGTTCAAHCLIISNCSIGPCRCTDSHGKVWYESRSTKWA